MTRVEANEAAALERRLAQLAEENDTLREINRQLREALVATDVVLPAVPLSKSETTIFGMLMARTFVTKEALTVALYGDRQNPPDPKTLEALLSRLRKKLKRAGIAAPIENAWGQGWRFSAEVKRAIKEGSS